MIYLITVGHYTEKSIMKEGMNGMKADPCGRGLQFIKARELVL